LVKYDLVMWAWATGGTAVAVLGIVIYFGLGLIQIVAIMAGLVDGMGLPWLLAAPVAAILGYIPFIGAILGMIGAINVWHWEWGDAGLLFFGGFALSIAVGGLDSLATVAGSILGRRVA
jgi:hypothetical protein